MKKLKKGERGFTLVEMLIVLAITSLVTGGITMTVLQVFNINTRTTNRMAAVRQVENAGFWVSHDAQMAMNVSTESEFLELTWIEWDTSNNHTVIYTLVDMPSGEFKKLQRKHYIDSNLDSTTAVAEYIDPAQTGCYWDEGDWVLTFTVTATVGGQSETREYEVMPRPGSG